MNVLRIIGTMNPSMGGPCQGIRNSIPELEKLGMNTEVVCLDDPNAPYLGTDSFPIHALGTGSGPWYYNAKLRPWLVDNVGRFDAVIAHGLWLYSSYAASKALIDFRRKKDRSKKDPKLFMMPHGMLDPYFQRASGRKIKALRNWAYWKLIESHTVNTADGVLFTCEAELQLAREPFRPYHPRQELNVGYGIMHPPLFSPEMRDAFQTKCPDVTNEPYFLFLSRIHQKKGVDLLLNAYHQVVEKYPGKTLPKLVIAGPGMENSYGERMKQLVSTNKNLVNKVFFPGMLEGKAKWGAFYGCEAFILPSHQENFGIAVVEALACSKAVLISDQVNIWREIDAEKGGLVAPNTVVGTQELLEKWINFSESKKAEMSSQGYSVYKKYFAIDKVAIRLFKALSS